MMTPDGCWADYRVSAELTRDRPCLFLDRDGVLIADTGYPHVAAAVVLIPEAIACVALAQRAGFVAGIVSNQSGIGRGYFGWEAFAAVQARIDDALAEVDARLDFVLACPHHPSAARPPFTDDHPWRKPRSGMLVAAHHTLGLDVRRSIMLGDRMSDMEAAAGAGVRRRLLLDGPPAAATEGGSITRVTRGDVGSTLAALVAPPHAGL